MSPELRETVEARAERESCRDLATALVALGAAFFDAEKDPAGYVIGTLQARGVTRTDAVRIVTTLQRLTA